MTAPEAFAELTRTCLAYANGCESNRVNQIHDALEIVRLKLLEKSVEEARELFDQ